MTKYLFARSAESNKKWSISELISLKARHNQLLDELMCPACSCKLIFCNGGKRLPYLKSVGEHDENCPYRVEKKWVNSKTRAITKGISYLNSDEQNSRALSMYYSFRRMYNEEFGVHSEKKKTQRKSRKLVKNGHMSSLVVSEGTVNTYQKGNEITKRKRLKATFPSRISTADIGHTVEIAGLLSKINVSRNRQYVTIIISYHESDIKLILNEAVFSESSIDFYDRFVDVSKIVKDYFNDTIIVSAVAEIIPDINKKDIDCMIRSEKAILLNGSSIYKFIRNHPKK